MTDAARTYTRRQFVVYRDVVQRPSGKRPEEIVAEYVRANPGADLDQELTFAEWLADSERTGG